MGDSAPLRVLFLSDQPAEAERLAGLLRTSGFDVAWKRASSAVEFRRHLHTPFDLILSAKSADGLEASEALRVMGQEGRRFPFIVVDPSLEPAFAAACLDGGALTCVAPENLVEAIRLNHNRIRPGITAEPPLPKTPEDVLRESEEKFRSLAEESPSMIFINQGGRVVYANPQAALVVGYTREELCDPAFDFMTLIAPDSRELALGNLDRHRRGEDISPYTYALVARDGRRIEAIHTTRLIQYDGAPAILGIVTDITEQRRVEASLARRAAQLATLSEIGARIAAMADVKEVLERAAHLVHERFGYQHVGIFLKVAGTGALRMEARAGSFDEILSSGHTVALGDGMVGSAAASGEVLLANDVELEPRYINYFPDRVRTRSELSVPIRTGGATVGVLDVQSTQGEAFGDNDVLVLGILGDQLGAVIADARLYEALRASEERYRALSENAAIGIYRTTPDGQILLVNPAGVRMLGFDSMEDLTTRNLETEGFSPTYPRAQFKERLEREGEIIGMESAWSRRDGSTIYVRENARLVRDEAGQTVYYEGTVEDISDRKRAEETLERRAAELEALYETSLEVSRQADVGALLQTIIERAARLVGTNSGGLYLVRPERQVLEMVVSYNLPRDFVGVTLAVGEGLSGQVALRGEPMAIPDYSNWSGRSGVYAGYRFGRALGVPLRRGADILGVIVITDPTQAGDFSPEEVRLVSLFADQAAAALENARLLEAERQRVLELGRAHQLLAGLSRVAARLERTHDPDQVLTTLREHLLTLEVNFWMAMIEPGTGDLIVRYATPEPGLVASLEKTLGLTVRGFRIPRQNLPFYDELFGQRKPMMVDSTWLVRQIAPALTGPLIELVLQATGIGPQTKTICLPLESESGVLGALFLWGDDLNESDVETYAVFASQVAVAFEQARLLDVERQRSTALTHSHGLLTALSQVATNIERTQDPDEFLKTMGVELGRIGLGCALATIDPEAEGFILRYLSLSPEVQSQMEKVVVSPLIGRTVPGKKMPMYAQLVRERRTILKGSADIVRQVFPRLPKKAIEILLRVTGASTSTQTIGIPLVSRDLVTAVLFVWGEGLEESDMSSYGAFGSQVAVALEKARLIDEMRQHATYLGAVVKVAGALRTASSRSDMLPILLDQLLELMHADGAALEVVLPSGQQVRTELARGIWADWTGRMRPAHDGVRGYALRQRQPYLTDHAPADDLFHRRDDLAGARAVACVPLVSQEQTIGLLWTGRRAPFADPETRIVMAVADMAASAIHRAGVMENLEERVQQRTRALEGANLQLQELDKMKSDFVSNVSHELRTPIANILLYLDLLADAARESRRGEYQAILRREAERLARLIEDLLTLSRLERDTVQSSFEAHALDPILGEVTAAHRARAEAKGIRLIHEPDPDLPAAWVSREQIVQVFTNLVSNAVAYTPEGGTVLVSTRGTRAHGRRHLVGRVHNSGLPIPPEDLPHIFERFYRGRTARFSGEPGTGLGLAISKDIVERHQGWIEVESNASVGTTFSVWLPVSPP